MNRLTPYRTPHDQRQDSTWNPARLVAWLVCENDRLRVRVRELETALEKAQERPKNSYGVFRLTRPF